LLLQAAKARAAVTAHTAASFIGRGDLIIGLPRILPVRGCCRDHKHCHMANWGEYCHRLSSM
jgi:hypothetical protein